MGSPAYATVEDVARALDVQHSPFRYSTLRRLVLSESRLLERRVHRHFYPLTEAVTFKNPRIVTPEPETAAGFWLDRDLLSLSAVTQDGDAVTPASVALYPGHYGAPYSWVGLTGATIVLTGDWGYSNDTEPAGALEEAVSDTTGTAVDVTDSTLIGIGDLIVIDSERLIVTDKTMIDTTENLAGALTADTSDVAVAVGDGSVFAVDETILVNSERMLITDIAGNTLTVSRAHDGTVLAAHSSSDDVYAPRRLTVERGAAGSTAATHSDTTAITRNVPPEPIRTAVIAETLNTMQQELSAYARVVGSGENAREMTGAGLADARAKARHFRRVRLGATL